MHFELKSGIISALALGAALLICFSSAGFLKDPSKIYRLEKSSFAKPETLNTQLNWLQGILAPLDQYLPPDVGLRYVGQEEAFDYFQAVLAPRRIALDLDSPFLLVYAEPGKRLTEYSALYDATLLIQLTEQIAILQKENRH